MKLLDDDANYRIDKEENSEVVTCTLRVKHCRELHNPLDPTDVLPHIWKRESYRGELRQGPWLGTIVEPYSTEDIYICFG